MDDLSASLQEELSAYMKKIQCTLEERKTMFEVYKKIIINERMSSIRIPTFVKIACAMQSAESHIYDPHCYTESYLDYYDDVAIIPLLARLSRNVANMKPLSYDKLGWNFLARLFEEWLVQPAYTRIGDKFEENAPYKIADVMMKDGTTPGMEWVLKYSRAQEEYQKLIKDTSFQSEGFLKLLHKIFFSDSTIVHAANSPVWMDICQEQGNYQNNMSLKHKFYLQTRLAEDTYWNLAKIFLNGAESASGLDAALHGFAFHALLGGKIVSVNNNEEIIEMDTLAIYYKDSFDFTDEQSLGGWQHPFGRGQIPLSNRTFRRYRGLMKVGRDFYVFSKNKIVSPQERGWNVLRYRLKRTGNQLAELL